MKFAPYNNDIYGYENHWLKHGIQEKRTYYMIEQIEFIIYSTKYFIIYYLFN